MKIKIGDLFASKAKTLVNTVNCVGVMGKGIALEFKKRYPAMFEEYVSLCSVHAIKPGQLHFYQDISGNSILLFPTKNHWRSPSQLTYIIDGLDWFRAHYREYGITSAAFPPLGCGNGGLSWSTVGPIMYNKLQGLPIEIEIFAPYGAKLEEMSITYLEDHFDDQRNKIGKQTEKINPYWYLILYVVSALNYDRYALNVGRVILQKICYVLTRCGIMTGFKFSKASYGPFSSEVKTAIGALSNANLMSEKKLGRMIEICVSPDFKLDKKSYSDEEMMAVDRTIDLFCRIQNTDQAEMLTTVMFAFDALCKEDRKPTETEIVTYVEDWKPHWKTDKHAEIISVIKGLAELKWISPNYREGFIAIEDDIF